MKIQIRDDDRNFHLTLPTQLIFSRFVLRMVLKHSSFGESVKGLPPGAADKLIDELKRIQKKHGTWELVEVKSADGETVKITL